MLPRPLSKLAATSEISQGAQHQLFPSGYPAAILRTDWRGMGGKRSQLRCVDGSILFLSLSTLSQQGHTEHYVIGILVQVE